MRPNLIIAFCIMLLCATAHAQSFVDLYREGLAAAEKRDWPTVIDRMSRAAAADGNDQASRLLHGRFPRPYLPHHYLAIAYAETNQCDRAREVAGKASLQQALAAAALSAERQRQAEALGKCQAPAPPPPEPPPTPPTPAPTPAPPSFDAAGALDGLRKSADPLRKQLQPLRNVAGELSDQTRRDLTRIEGELQTVLASPPASAAEAEQRQAQLTRITRELAQLQTRADTERRDQQVLAARGRLQEQIAAADQLLASPALAGLQTGAATLREQLRQAKASLAGADTTPANLQARADALAQALGSLRQELAARERDAQQSDPQLASLRDCIEAIARITPAQLRADAQPTLTRAQRRLVDARNALTKPQPDTIAALLRELTDLQSELEKAVRARAAYVQAWTEFRPLLLAYSQGDAPAALAITVKADWPAELRAHAGLLRAATLWISRAPITEVDRELDAARDASGAPLRLPPKAFPPALLQRAESRGLRMTAGTPAR